MKRNSLMAVGALAAVFAVAGCASAGTPPKAAETQSAGPTGGVRSSSPTAVVSSATDTANERQYVNWLALSAPPYGPQIVRLIDGSRLRGWSELWALTADADAQYGTPDGADTVTPIKGGYRLCGQSSNANCNSFTGFRFNPAGGITSFLTNGYGVGGSVSVAPRARGSQLAISHVAAQYYPNTHSIAVAFDVRNVSSQVVGSVSPAFLAIFNAAGGGQYQATSQSTLPGPLQPGESAAAYAMFATQVTAGQFSLRSNDQIMTVLASTTLRRVR